MFYAVPEREDIFDRISDKVTPYNDNLWSIRI